MLPSLAHLPFQKVKNLSFLCCAEAKIQMSPNFGNALPTTWKKSYYRDLDAVLSIESLSL